MIQFTVLGKAIPSVRTRRRKVFYNPVNSCDYQQCVRIVAQEHAPDELIEAPVIVSVKIYKPLPVRASQKSRALAEAGLYRPITNPDVDNYGKAVANALNQVVLKNDSQIVEMTVSKFYSEQPRIEVRVEVLEEVVGAYKQALTD